jgi:hypothetical protein
MAAASVEFHTLESTVRGRHVYKTLWNPVVGHVLHIQSEDSTTYDSFAVATHLRASSFQSVASPEHLDSDIGFCCRSFPYFSGKLAIDLPALHAAVYTWGCGYPAVYINYANYVCDCSFTRIFA